MKSIILSIITIFILFSCKKTDQITVKTWSYFIENETDKNATIYFYSKTQPLLNFDTIILKKQKLELFKGSNDVSGEDDLTAELYDSAKIVFEDSKEIFFTYNKQTGANKPIHNILLKNNYVLRDSTKTNSNYYYIISNEDYSFTE